MKIRFLSLTAQARAPRSLSPQTPVATFEAEDGKEAVVLAGHASPFVDLPFAHTSGRVREDLLLALCAHVQYSEWHDADTRQLALSQRFVVEPDRDEPAWSLKGFTSIQNVDLHVIKHVLGVSEPEPGSDTRWQELLRLKIERQTLLDELERQGCVEWKRLSAPQEPETERPISLYRQLSNRARAACIRLLAPIRERYMTLASDAVRSTANLRNARHVHLGVGHEVVMHFLDDAGVIVIAKGGQSELSISTSFSALAGGERSTGPVTLRKRWVRILNDPGALSGNMRLHSPLAWRVST